MLKLIFIIFIVPFIKTKSFKSLEIIYSRILVANISANLNGCIRASAEKFPVGGGQQKRRPKNSTINSIKPLPGGEGGNGKRPKIALLRAVHKRRPHKIAKNLTLPPCPYGHAINFEKSRVFLR